jgi:AcrR family transcriptional regulator
MNKFSEKRKAAVDEAMREAVCDSAIKLLVESGLGALTMERLARSVGVSRATLYNYFRDRDDLLIYVGDRLFEPLRRQLADIAAGDAAPSDKLSLLAEASLRYVDENRSIILNVYDKETVEGARRQAQIRRREALREIFAATIREGIEKGQFRKVDAARAAEVFEGGLVGLVDAMMDRGEFLAPEDTVPHFVSIFLHGIE